MAKKNKKVAAAADKNATAAVVADAAAAGQTVDSFLQQEAVEETPQVTAVEKTEYTRAQLRLAGGAEEKVCDVLDVRTGQVISGVTITVQRRLLTSESKCMRIRALACTQGNDAADNSRLPDGGKAAERRGFYYNSEVCTMVQHLHNGDEKALRNTCNTVVCDLRRTKAAQVTNNEWRAEQGLPLLTQEDIREVKAAIKFAEAEGDYATLGALTGVWARTDKAWRGVRKVGTLAVMRLRADYVGLGASESTKEARIVVHAATAAGSTKAETREEKEARDASNAAVVAAMKEEVLYSSAAEENEE